MSAASKLAVGLAAILRNLRTTDSLRPGWHRAVAACALLAASCGDRAGENTARSSAGAAFSFREAASGAGLHFRHIAGATGEFYLPEITGSGLAVFDYDMDGDLDVFFVQSGLLDPAKKPSEARFPPEPGAPEGSRLFRNELVPSGRLRFTDVTGESGIAYRRYGMGVAAGDFDGDGRPDLYITGIGGNALYRNTGRGGFVDVTDRAGVREGAWSTGATFVDYDRDGDLDLFVSRYLDFQIRSNRVCQNGTGERDYCGPIVYPPMTSRLYRNQGDGTFTEVSKSAGIDKAAGNGFTAAAADLNGDEWPEIVVANDTTPNHLWMNGKDGTFAENGVMAGLAYSSDGATFAGMGLALGDFDGDGDDDIFVTNLAKQHNTLYRNEGGGRFSEVAAQFDLDAASRAYTGWGAGWVDFDHDGNLDLFTATGAVITEPNLRGEKYPYHQRNQLFRNPGRGARFIDVSAQSGSGMQLSDGSRGAGFGDIDNDGDIDIVISNNDGPARLLLNESGNRRPWLIVDPVAAGGRDASGARVGVMLNGGRTIWRRAARDGSYLSASDIRVHFGLADEGSISGVAAKWPAGQGTEVFDVKEVNRIVRLEQGKGKR